MRCCSNAPARTEAARPASRRLDGILELCRPPGAAVAASGRVAPAGKGIRISTTISSETFDCLQDQQRQGG